MSNKYLTQADKETPKGLYATLQTEGFKGSYKSIPDNPNYLVVDDGRVWSVKKRKFLAQANHKCGYLFAGGKYKSPDCDRKKMLLVHRLVATAFIPNPDNLPEVGHRDNNKHHNHRSNLYWTTHKDNMKDAREDGLMTNFYAAITKGENNGRSKLTAQDVTEIKWFKSLNLLTTRKLAELYKVSYSCVRDIFIGRTWSHLEPLTQQA